MKTLLTAVCVLCLSACTSKPTPPPPVKEKKEGDCCGGKEKCKEVEKKVSCSCPGCGVCDKGKGSCKCKEMECVTGCDCWCGGR